MASNTSEDFVLSQLKELKAHLDFEACHDRHVVAHTVLPSGETSPCYEVTKEAVWAMAVSAAISRLKAAEAA